MAAPSALTVAVDLEEYSRFEIAENRATITVSIGASGGGDMSGEQITVELIKGRRLRDSVIHTTTATLSGTSDPNTVTATIYLPDVLDSESISLIRRGRFFVKVTSVTDTNITASSSDFLINIVTAQMLRDTYLFGIPLNANDVRSVKNQPVLISGVEVVEVSQNHTTGFGIMTYRYDSTNGIRHLSWSDGGHIVPITQVGQYILKADCTGGSYIVVQIRNMDALPTTDVKEELLVEKNKIGDDLLRRWIEQACDWLENDKIAGVYLEPTRLVTETENSSGTTIDWDVITPPITFYPSNPDRWIDILFPYMSLLRINELYGQIANTRILNVDTTWAEIAEKNGFVQLVPFNQEAAFTFLGLVWVESLRGKIELPNFWHYDALAGLREADPIIQEIIAKKAGIDALTVAGQAFRGGFSSQSISRDGVSESVSYTSSAIYGIYSASIEDFTKFINREIKQIKGHYRGVNLLVL